MYIMFKYGPFVVVGDRTCVVVVVVVVVSLVLLQRSARCCV